MSQMSITAYLKKRPCVDEANNEVKRSRLSPSKTTDTPEKKEIEKTYSRSPLKEQISPQPSGADMNVVIQNTKKKGALALHENIGKSWFRALQDEFNKDYFHNLGEFIAQQRKSNTVFPPEDQVYSWTQHHDIKVTRVVILGQDPYHGPGQAHGLCFSVQKGVQKPPSLVNIFKELQSDVKNFRVPEHGDLTGWAKQGVLLLNTCLTVNKGAAFSHSGKGWETFTDMVIKWINKNVTTSVVFLLWGLPAQKKKVLISSRHKVLTSAHPSPLSCHRQPAPFFGCRHFTKTNEYLRKQGLPEIDWTSL